MSQPVERDQWVSRKGFIFAAVGAAIGLGNLWRFPFQAYSNGGGAFLLPYFVALLTAGVPLMIMEYGFGHRMRGAAALAFRKLGRRWEWLGWWQSMIPVMVMMFYSTIVSWSLCYIVYSLTGAWGDNPGAFFGGEFLAVSSGPWDFDGVRWHILGATAVVWFLNWYISRNGISGGIEKATRIFTPMLLLLMVAFMIRGLTLDGAVDGLNHLFRPDFSRLLEPGIWISAYSQVFFSATIGVGVMIAYASYLPKNSDIVNNAFITVFSNAMFDIIAGITVFTTLGFIAYSQGVDFSKVAQGGPGIAFVAFPQAISEMPAGQTILGVLFFVCVFVAGLSSSISMLESFASSLLDKLDISRKKLITRLSLLGFAGSALYTTGAGVHILDIVDHFIGSYGIALCGLAEAIILGWVFGAERMREHVNATSDFAVGRWWTICIRYITPILLGYMFISNVIDELAAPYAGYPGSAVAVFGWCVAGGIVVIAVLLSRTQWKAQRRLILEREDQLWSR